MIAAFIFFALLGVFVYTAVQTARGSSVRPDSHPGDIVQAEDGSGEHMNPKALICSCHDWQRRRSRFKTGTPMRLCSHLTGWYARHLMALPEALRTHAALVALLAREGVGLPCGPGTEYGHLDDVAYVLYVVRRNGMRARLVLGGRRYELDVDSAQWFPEPPPQADYYLPRARQLARAARKK